MAGRPSKYSAKLAAEICERVADGQSVKEICRAENMPSSSMVFRWLNKHEEFRDQYARAKEAGLEALADEMLEIADEATNDWIERQGRDGEFLGYRENGDAISRSKLRVDTRKWLLSKLVPKKYGEKVQTEHSGDLKVVIETNVNRKLDQ